MDGTERWKTKHSAPSSTWDVSGYRPLRSSLVVRHWLMSGDGWDETKDEGHSRNNQRELFSRPAAVPLLPLSDAVIPSLTASEGSGGSCSVNWATPLRTTLSAADKDLKKRQPSEFELTRWRLTLGDGAKAEDLNEWPRSARSFVLAGARVGSWRSRQSLRTF